MAREYQLVFSQKESVISDQIDLLRVVVDVPREYVEEYLVVYDFLLEERMCGYCRDCGGTVQTFRVQKLNLKRVLDDGGDITTSTVLWTKLRNHLRAHLRVLVPMPRCTNPLHNLHKEREGNKKELQKLESYLG